MDPIQVCTHLADDGRAPLGAGARPVGHVVGRAEQADPVSRRAQPDHRAGAVLFCLLFWQIIAENYCPGFVEE